MLVVLGLGRALERGAKRHGIRDALSDEHGGHTGDVRRGHAGSVEHAELLALVATTLANGLLRDLHAGSANAHLRTTG